jgi:hypothetical protein
MVEEWRRGELPFGRMPTIRHERFIAMIRTTTPAVVLSPTRLRILKVCLILMPFLLVSLLISRAVDMHQETHQPMLQALYDANANLGGLSIIFVLGTSLFSGLLFYRRQWPGQKLS